MYNFDAMERRLELTIELRTLGILEFDQIRDSLSSSWPIHVYF